MRCFQQAGKLVRRDQRDVFRRAPPNDHGLAILYDLIAQPGEIRSGLSVGSFYRHQLHPKHVQTNGTDYDDCGQPTLPLHLTSPSCWLAFGLAAHTGWFAILRLRCSDGGAGSLGRSARRLDFERKVVHGLRMWIQDE